MNRSKKLYVLLGVLVGICGVTFAVSRYQEHQEDIKNSDEVVMEIDSEAVESLSWSCELGNYAFAKNADGIWKYESDDAFPVSADKIEELLDEFTEFGASFVIENVDDFAQYGLDDPTATIDIATADETYEITLGDFSTMDEERYVSIGDGNVYLVSDDPNDAFNVEISALIENDDTPDYDTVQELSFASSEDDGTYTVTYQEEGGESYRDSDVYFTTTTDGVLPLNTSKVNGYCITLKYLDLTDYATYTATDDDLATYGLDDPELTVTFTYTPKTDDDEEADPQTFVLAVSRDPEERAASLASDDTETEDTEDTESDEDSDEEEVTAYARVGDSKIIYRLTTDDYNELVLAGYNDLRHDDILPADMEDIAQIDITLDGQAYSLTAGTDDDDNIIWYRGEDAINSDDLNDALEALVADGYTKEKASDIEEISLKVHIRTDDEDGASETVDSTEQGDESSDNGATVAIGFYRYDGTDCLVTIDGTPTALVSRSQVVDLVEAVNAIVLN